MGQRGFVFYRGSRGESIPYLFQLLRATCILWLGAPHHPNLCFLLPSSRLLSDSDPRDDAGPTRIIQALSLPVPRSLTESHLQSLLHYVRYTITGTLTSPGGHSSSHHTPPAFTLGQEERGLPSICLPCSPAAPTRGR